MERKKSFLSEHYTFVKAVGVMIGSTAVGFVFNMAWAGFFFGLAGSIVYILKDREVESKGERG